LFNNRRKTYARFPDRLVDRVLKCGYDLVCLFHDPGSLFVGFQYFRVVGVLGRIDFSEFLLGYLYAILKILQRGKNFVGIPSQFAPSQAGMGVDGAPG
jgi:hypothetical protein